MFKSMLPRLFNPLFLQRNKYFRYSNTGNDKNYTKLLQQVFLILLKMHPAAC